MTRIEQLQQFMLDDPSDPFSYYALALELLHHEPAQAREQFEKLLTEFPEYLPTYYPAAHLLIDLGDQDGAEKLFQLGIEKAKAQGNRKTELELRQALEQWQFDRS
ncbi:MAG: tetratricopeptide repeat protein [Cyclobacteriaceae bacterium]|nr:tetratricopeptide repeat protein [Cyclobacteriaceae bacterium]